MLHTQHFKHYLLALNIFIHWQLPKPFHFTYQQQRLQAWAICQGSVSLITGQHGATNEASKSSTVQLGEKGLREIPEQYSAARISIEGHIIELYIHLSMPHELIISI